MKYLKKLPAILAMVMIVSSVLFFSGCQESQKTVESENGPPKGPLFYPPAPDIPRIQFLKSFDSTEDFLEKKKASGFDSFLMGDETTQEDEKDILRPYGFALYDNKFYICDLDLKMVMIFDYVARTYEPMTTDRRLARPVNICIDNGVKYISDTSTDAIFVFNKEDKLVAIWGRDEGMNPIGISVHKDYLYVLDAASSQIIVMDKYNGKEIKRLGEKGDQKGQLKYVTGLAVDDEGSVYISDKIGAFVTKLDSEGVYQKTIGFRGGNVHGFLRPKGLDIDKKGRMWIVDSGSNMGKVYDDQGKLLLYFSEYGNWPGDLYLPASIRIDYDHIDEFQQYAVDDAQIECLIIISNQYGKNKISVYALGKFPAEEKKRLLEKEQREKDLSGGVVATEQAEEKTATEQAQEKTATDQAQEKTATDQAQEKSD